MDISKIHSSPRSKAEQSKTEKASITECLTKLHSRKSEISAMNADDFGVEFSRQQFAATNALYGALCKEISNFLGVVAASKFLAAKADPDQISLNLMLESEPYCDGEYDPEPGHRVLRKKFYILDIDKKIDCLESIIQNAIK